MLLCRENGMPQGIYSYIPGYIGDTYETDRAHDTERGAHARRDGAGE